MHSSKTNAMMTAERGNAFCNPQDQICGSKQLPVNIGVFFLSYEL